MYYIYPIDVYFKRFSSKKVGIFFKKYAYFVNSLSAVSAALFLCAIRLKNKGKIPLIFHFTYNGRSGYTINIVLQILLLYVIMTIR